MKIKNTHQRKIYYCNCIILKQSQDKIKFKKYKSYKNPFSKLFFNNTLLKGSLLEDYIEIEDFIMENKLFFCFGQINEMLTNMLINKFLYSSLNDNSYNSYKILINSPGGDIVAGLALYDMLTLNNYKLNTTGLGVAASMGAFLLSSGNTRLVFPNTRIMIHQPLGGIQGTITEIEIQAKELIFHKNNLNYLLSKLTGQSISKIEKDTTRDKYLTPLEATEYGLIDNVISSNRAITFKKFSYLKFSRSSTINWNEINKFI